MEGAILLRAGLLDPEAHLAYLAERWTRYVAKPGRKVTPPSELSFEARIKQYEPAENFTNRAISYYEKSERAALALERRLIRLPLRRGSGRAAGATARAARGAPRRQPDRECRARPDPSARS